MTRNAADALAEALTASLADTVFGLPGDRIDGVRETIRDALSRESSIIVLQD